MTGILFDLDGTLLDTLADLADSTNFALRCFGYPERTIDEVRRFVGNGAAMLIRRAVPEKADPAPVLEVFRNHYQQNCENKTAPYPDIPEVLAQLSCPMAIVSNKPDSAVKALCAKYFPGIFALGESADCPRKPAPDMVKKAMAAIGVDQCIYIGDSEVDVLTAQNAGVPCLSVLWGFRDKEEIGGSHYCSTPAELPAMIRRLCK